MEHEKPKLSEVEETNDNCETAAGEDSETVIADPATTKQQVVSSNLVEESTEKIGDEISPADALALRFAEMHISTDRGETKQDKKSSSPTDKSSADQEVAANPGLSLKNVTDDAKVELEDPSAENKMKEPICILRKRNKVFDFAKMVPESESDSNSDY